MRIRRQLGWMFLIALAALTACGVPGIPKPPSLNLPQPVTDLRAVRKGDRVFLAWTVPTRATDSVALRHLGPTQVCRSTDSSISDCRTAAGEVAAPETPTKDQEAAKQSYTDSLPANLLSDNTPAEVFYAVSVLNQNGRSAGLSNIVGVPAVVAPAPPSDFKARITADGVVVSWNEMKITGGTHFYRVYRRAEESTTDFIAGEVPVGSVQYVDHNFEWEKTYFYRATVVTVIRADGKPEIEFESDDTPPVRVFAHDIFPPTVPSGLQAAFSGPGQQPFIDLIWAPDTDADLTGYNVYRRENGEARKINAALVKAPAFRDADVASGHTYLYSVSAVDARGNESARSGETSEAVP